MAKITLLNLIHPCFEAHLAQYTEVVLHSYVSHHQLVSNIYSGSVNHAYHQQSLFGSTNHRALLKILPRIHASIMETLKMCHYYENKAVFDTYCVLECGVASPIFILQVEECCIWQLCVMRKVAIGICSPSHITHSKNNKKLNLLCFLYNSKRFLIIFNN